MARYGNRYDYEDQWPPYVPVAERRRQAERAVEALRKKGRKVAPVTIAGRAIASTFWGKAWCDNLDRYRDYANRIERGRSYVRNGAVVDLQITPGEVSALVSGSELYEIKVKVAETPAKLWGRICADCAGGIDTLVELLQGRFAKGVMERICREGDGLFPKPGEIRFSCSCPDFALLCKHVAASLLGVGARLDAQPELLFRLRGVKADDLVAHIDVTAPLTKAGPAAGKVLESDDLSALFGLDMDGVVAPAEPEPTVPARRAAVKQQPTGRKTAGTKPPGSTAAKAAPVRAVRPNQVTSKLKAKAAKQAAARR